MKIKQYRREWSGGGGREWVKERKFLIHDCPKSVGQILHKHNIMNDERPFQNDLFLLYFIVCNLYDTFSIKLLKNIINTMYMYKEFDEICDTIIVMVCSIQLRLQIVHGSVLDKQSLLLNNKM